VAEEALREYIRQSFDYARGIRYLEDPGEYALALTIARMIEEEYGVSLLREALELRLELSRHARARAKPLSLEALERVSQLPTRFQMNVMQRLRQRRTENLEEF